MRTVVISVEELPKKPKGYPVHLHFDDGSGVWLQKNRALATSSIPEDLTIASPPEDPLDEQPLRGERLREIFLEETGSSDRFQAIGEYLYKLLFSGKVGAKWEELRLKYPKEDGPTEGMRTILDIKPKPLRLLPWELMTDSKLSLFLDPYNPIVRGAIDPAAQPPSCQWPLHVLVVVGSKDGDPNVRAEEEIADIEAALITFGRPVEWDLLKRPANQALVDKLKTFRPNILHFIGHGRKGSGTKSAVLVFEAGESNPAWEWTEKKIALDLRQSSTPRFAFINACRSSQVQEVEKVGDITQAFMEAGVPAVLGMQADVRGDAAARFPGKLYEGLAKDYPLDSALAEARGEVSRLMPDGLERRDWALATFFLSVQPGQILPMEPPGTQAFRDKIKAQFYEISDFVGRKEPRRTLWSGVEPPPDSTDAKSLLIIKGLAESGKTWLVQWCLRGCAWRERNVTYVSLKEKETAKDLLQVLRMIKRGDGEHNIGRPLRDDAFHGFNETVNYLLDPDKKEPPPSGQAVVDKGFPFREDVDADSIKEIIGAFKVALQKAANNQPLVIALDDLLVRKDHFKEFLIPELIGPIAKRQEETLKKIRMILVGTNEQYVELGLEDLNNVSVTVPLVWIPQDELNLFSRELCILKGLSRDRADLFFNFINTDKPPTLKPDDVRQILNLWLKIKSF